MSNKDIQLSKTLSWLLRHGATKECLNISSDGYISVQEILGHRSLRDRYNKEDIERVVATNNKQRFKLRFNDSTNTLAIKANQGHSIEINDTELKQILEPQYDTVIHGTYYQYWSKIKIEGLCRMKRKHIHFAKGTYGDREVISGLRQDVEIYIFINLTQALADGVLFYESENGVILTEGNGKGLLEPKYFSKVIDKRTGYPDYVQHMELVKVFSKYGPVTVESFNSQSAILVFAHESEAKDAIRDSGKVNVYGEFMTVTPASGKSQPAAGKRRVPRSKEKGVLVEPDDLNLSGDFHSQLASLLAAVRLSQEEVVRLATLYQDLASALQQHWPGCVAIPFGSITTGLGVKGSDVDCYVQLPGRGGAGEAGGALVARARRVLALRPRMFADVFAIPRANTPIVKFVHVPTAFHCDVTFKTPLGTRNSRLVAFLLQSDPRLTPLAVVVKYWARINGFSGTGKLTNYALTALVLFYLQQAPASLLPPVELLQRDAAVAEMVDGWNTGFSDNYDELPDSTNTSSISELLGGFFQYYSTFDFAKQIVCPFLGKPVSKELFKDLDLLPSEFYCYVKNVKTREVAPLRFTTSICVQDPFEHSHNVSSMITSRMAAEIIEYFKFAAAAYDKEKLDGCATLLATILLEKPKVCEKPQLEFRTILLPHVLRKLENPDWMSVVREVTVKIFEHICKIKMEKIDEPPSESMKKRKDKYMCVLTKAIWKRKQFSKLYSMMKLDFIEKQTRITEEVINVEKEIYNIPFRLTVTYKPESRHTTLSIKLLEEHSFDHYREFGKFFASVILTWYFNLLKDYSLPGEAPADGVAAVDAPDLNESVSQTDDSDASFREDAQPAESNGVD